MSDPFAELPDKDRMPASARILDRWVRDAEVALQRTDGRIGWILASTVAIAALQRALGQDRSPMFLLKGGVYLERRLPQRSRATQDVDTLFRGELDELVSALDLALKAPWGQNTLSRSELR